MQQHTLEEIIGSNLARYRKSAGMTQSALAGEIGTSIAFVSRVEKGEKMMKVQTLCAAARALDVSLDALVSADGPAAARADILRLLSELPDEYLNALKRIIRLCLQEFEPRQKAPSPAEPRHLSGEGM